MSAQDGIALAIVALAVAYLVWRFMPRRSPPPKKGPDVPLSRLRKKK